MHATKKNTLFLFIAPSSFKSRSAAGAREPPSPYNSTETVRETEKEYEKGAGAGTAPAPLHFRDVPYPG
jgi:hypothetical protein